MESLPGIKNVFTNAVCDKTLIEKRKIKAQMDQSRFLIN